MSSIYVRITGGLGNQVFQLLKAYKLHLETGKKIMLVDKFQNDFFRRKSFIETDLRDFSLVKAGFVDNDVIYHCKAPGFFCRFIFKLRIAKILSNKNFLKFFGNLYLDGYFINNEAFGDEFHSFKEKIYQTHSIKRKEGCAIHVRAGDLLRQPQNLLITKDYYLKSIEILNENYNVDNFLIVTEDIQFAESFFSDVNDKYLFNYQSSSEIDDFISLLKYEFLICANSTFSWIAGLLGQSRLFISTEYFYIPNDKPVKLNKELVLKFDGSEIG